MMNSLLKSKYITKEDNEKVENDINDSIQLKNSQSSFCTILTKSSSSSTFSSTKSLSSSIKMPKAQQHKCNFWDRYQTKSLNFYQAKHLYSLNDEDNNEISCSNTNIVTNTSNENTFHDYNNDTSELNFDECDEDECESCKLVKINPTPGTTPESSPKNI